MTQVPTIGRIVHYTLSEQDADAINRRRADARAHFAEHQENANGVQVHVGNNVQAGDVCPLIITRVWGNTPESSVNGQVLLDGNDLFWATSVAHGEGERKFVWPPRV
jgi:hypothetical protein